MLQTSDTPIASPPAAPNLGALVHGVRVPGAPNPAARVPSNYATYAHALSAPSPSELAYQMVRVPLHEVHHCHQAR